jgi:hypothetical protein
MNCEVLFYFYVKFYILLRSATSKTESSSGKRPHEEVKYADTSQPKKSKHEEEEDDAELISDIK